MNLTYYDRYWSDGLKEAKIAELPPKRNERQILRIVNCFKQYCKGIGLDAGCGDGHLTVYLSNLNTVEKIIGIDISPNVITMAQKAFPNIEFRVASVTNIPFESSFFDFIIAVELIEHILDTESMFNEFNRVLKRGGYLFITTTVLIC